ncbi:carboxylesterase family protein [Panacibacter sp. DH6]|uniref:Carboxylic ester hydrolase n=1 Tax=Panacibacter microcysteis TaxID=2793269 RepID=A0A931GZ21_9BACT|nr:carboxylesterase family protein [Panacibacter microcysteis]MBG9377982.1 carboxylesterase family protein [Panacibacter microcysteis]
MSRNHILLAAASCIAVFCIHHSFAQVAPAFEQVKVAGGIVSGMEDKQNGITVFKGIPFAAPPVGALRWKAPQPVLPWNGVKACTNFGPSPMQASPAPFSMWSEEFLIPKEPISEDCLYLNVWTGATSSKEKRPVLVWIYGGGFASGGSAVPIYDGAAMAKRGIVFVSINYRVGIFGFFAHPALTKESGKNASGNYGLMDQVAALQWVHDHIPAFGGDAANVTIAGQSAGSMSVNYLVASPLAKGLFKRAIAQSGASFTNANPPLKTAEQDGEKVMQALQANSIEEMRTIPAETLMKQGGGLRRPIIDGYVLPDAIVNIFKQHKANEVDLLTGWNQDEGLMFGPVKNAADFKNDMTSTYGANAKALLQYYPAGNDEGAAKAQLDLSRDVIFGVQNYTWANMQSLAGGKVFMYRFTRKVPGTGVYARYGAFHTGEVPYAYDNLRFVNRPWQSADHQLAKTMCGYWVNFIRTGNPNGKDLPVWNAYNTTGKNIVLLGEAVSSAPLPDAPALDLLWQELSAR